MAKEVTKNKNNQNRSLFVELFTSTGDGKTSVSKLAMIVGLIVGSYVVIQQTYNNGISYDIFAIYMMSTLGANSVNKAIAVMQNIKESKYSNQYGNNCYQDRYSDYDNYANKGDNYGRSNSQNYNEQMGE
nr:MAG TPA: Protein of unknown function (DUF2644) [Caudoviricetes sp.]